jgi:putative transposase
VSTSASDAWTARCARGPSPAQQDQAALVALIRRIHARAHGTYGSPRITAELRRRG